MQSVRSSVESCYWSRARVNGSKKENNLWKMFLSSSCLVLAIKLYDKAANLKINILPLITFVSCFNHKFLLLIPLHFDSPWLLLMRFSSATLIMEASDFRCSIIKRASKWNLIQNRHKNNFWRLLPSASDRWRCIIVLSLSFIFNEMCSLLYVP